MKLTLYFDGACEPVNPGGTATYGWVLADEKGTVTEGRGMAKAGAGATNNVAEYYGLGHGLRSILEARLNPESLEIRGDSQLVIRQLTGQWACHKPHLAALRDRCLELLKALGCEWTATWIPRNENSPADGLSVKAWEEATGQRFPQRRRAK